MEDIKKVGFCEMSDSELMVTDGGVVITATVAGILIGAAVALFTGGLAAGVAVGLNRVNRTK
jgi:lactobin A/cerein 7B family class IIb bacteriocin